MKVIIEPTEGCREHPHLRVEVSLPHDDLSASEMVALFRAAMLGATFHPDTVKEHLGED